VDIRKRQWKVLAVDGEPQNLDLIRQGVGQEGCIVRTASSGEAAIEILDADPPDVILADLMLPGLSGVELLHRIRQHPAGRLLTVIVMTASRDTSLLHEALAAGANEMLAKPFDLTELQIRVRSALAQKRLLDHLEDAEAILFALARTVEAKDPTTGDHCDRLCVYAVHLGKTLKLDYEDLETLRRGAILHDIGKVAIPDEVLLAPRKLSTEEWAIMKRHPVKGAELCQHLRTARTTIPIVRHHHERWDGTGYPDGLSGESIPRLARVFQVVDIFDALTSRRPYKDPMTITSAIKQMESETANGKMEAPMLEAWMKTLQREPYLLRAIQTRYMSA
jgi:putative two-component system response regulator